MIDVPATAEPTLEVADEPPSVSVLVMAKVALGLSVSVSVAVTVEESAAEAVTVFDNVPVAGDTTAATTV